MGKKSKAKARTGTTRISRPAPKVPVRNNAAWRWLLPLLGITAIVFAPMLHNTFTNWDDEYYVIQNALLPGPDWKGIFSRPVVSNYHPLTIITLAMNYAMTGLDASSYLYTNLLLHLANTALVYVFMARITNRNHWVAFLTALFFGIHPMHVESVAWVSERKDVLYTLFFLLALLRYWTYLQDDKRSSLIVCFVFFLLSLLSKPAAIVLPFSLLALDYWKGRSWNKSIVWEKLPFLALSLVFGMITVKIQSKTAIAGLDFYPLWTRFFFACYSLMIYFFRFFIPYPLSAFHPFPPPQNLGAPVMIAPVFVLGAVVFIWFRRKDRTLVFSSLFYTVNLLLVLQVISIGATLVSERYTYVPYIGLGFLVSSLLGRINTAVRPRIMLACAAVCTVIFGIMTFNRTEVWNNSNTLWSDVIDHYPDAPVPRTNRANYLIREAAKPENANTKMELLQIALNDCTHSIEVKPNHAKGYENRENIYLTLNKDSLALKDANTLIRLEPDNKGAHFSRAVALIRLNQMDSALMSLNRCLAISNDLDYALNTRGSLYLNYYKKYTEALQDFNRAIALKPLPNYYFNRSVSNYYLHNMEAAKEDAATAIRGGYIPPADYRKALGL